MQLPPMQSNGAKQVIPQPPQLLSSELVSTHAPAQTVPVHTQLPELQMYPTEHALEQLPQCCSLVAVLMQEFPQTVLGEAQAHAAFWQVNPEPQ